MAINVNTQMPIVNNEYVGQTYGNILDFFDNPSYNLKLYMIRNPESADDEEASANPSLSASPQDTVVLAQTGVTGTQIDNLQIEQRLAATMKTVDVTFTITQPGAADFLDQIQLAKAYLGIENTSSTVLFLEIRFQGYSSDPEDNEAGGEITRIAGPFRWKLRLNDIICKIDQTGSTYDLTCRPIAQYAYRQPIFKLPQSISTVGKTLTEHLENLQQKVNNWHETAATNEVKDRIVIDYSKLIGAGAGGGNSQDVITDDTLLTSEDSGDAETLNRLANELWSAGDAIDRQQQLEAAPEYTGEQAEEIFKEDKISFTEGTSMDRVMLTYLSMCPEFYSKVSRKEDPLDPESKVKTDQAYVSWFRIHGSVKQLEFDPVRNDYAYEYTFIPVLYKTVNQSIAVSSDETKPINKDDAEARLSQIIANGGLQKSYNYLFTGLNDQILDLEIKYDSGVSILNAPKGGAIGDASVTDPARFSAQSDADADLTLEGTVRDLMDKVNDAVNLDKVTGFFDKLKGVVDDVSGAADSFTSGLSDLLDNQFSPDDIKNIIKGEGALTREELLSNLTGAELKKLATDAQVTETQTSTEDPTIINNGTGTGTNDYTPEISGYAYSADILSVDELMSTEINAADLVKQGYLTLSSTEVQEATTLKNKVETSVDVPDVTATATYKTGSPRNKLFGFLVNQHAAKRFLMNVDMTVRGDPWYLGGPGYDASTPEYANYMKDDNCFWLEIRSPIAYDPDWTDEDSPNNSGYWRYDGVSKTFSGLYKIQTVVCSFSGGLFTVGIDAIRTNLGAENIEKKASNTGTAEEQ